MFLNLERKLNSIIKIGIYGLLLMPLLVLKDFIYPFTFIRAIYFQILVEILLILSLLYFCISRQQRERIKKTPLFWAFLAFFIFSVLSAILGVNFHQSFWSNFERMDGIFFMSHLFILFLILRYFFIKGEDWRRFWIGFSLSGLLTMILSLIFQNRTDERLGGIFGNPLYLSVFLLFVIFVSLWQFFAEKKLCFKIASGLIFIFSLILIFFTGSRGPIIGLLAGSFLAILLMVFSKKISRKVRIVIASLFILFLALGTTLFFFKDASFLKNTAVSRSLSIGLEVGSQRILVWKIGLAAFKERPILGWGQDNFEIILNKHFSPEIYNYAGFWFDKPHNKYLEIVLNAGILGILAYLGMLVILGFYFIKLYQKKQLLVIFFSGLLVAYLIQNIFFFDPPTIALCFIMLISFLDFNYRMGLKNENQALKKQKNSRQLSPEKILYSIAIVVLIVILYQYNWQALRSSRFFSNALAMQTSPQVPAEKIIAEYQKALKAFPQNSEQFGIIMTEKIANLAIRGDQRFQNQNAFIFLKGELKKDLNQNPLNIKSYLGLIKVYEILGTITQEKIYLSNAEKTALSALKIYPLRLEFYRELGKIYEILGDSGKSEENYHKALPLKR